MQTGHRGRRPGLLTRDVLTARNLAFDKTTLTVPAGATVALTFINDDAGVQHNFALYTDSSATTPIFQGRDRDRADHDGLHLHRAGDARGRTSSGATSTRRP